MTKATMSCRYGPGYYRSRLDLGPLYQTTNWSKVFLFRIMFAFTTADSMAVRIPEKKIDPTKEIWAMPRFIAMMALTITALGVGAVMRKPSGRCRCLL